MWPIGRASRLGLAEFAVAAASLPLAVVLLQRAGVDYLNKSASLPPLVGGAALLVVVGAALFRIARRREYPWLLAFAAVALPFFDPTQAPYHAPDRVVFAVRDVVLAAAAILFIARSISSADELERRINGEALGWSYTAVVVLLLIQAMAADVLPPLRATWVISALLVSWVAAWVATSVRYQRQ